MLTQRVPSDTGNKMPLYVCRAGAARESVVHCAAIDCEGMNSYLCMVAERAAHNSGIMAPGQRIG
jgi:hypothetical protein